MGFHKAHSHMTHQKAAICIGECDKFKIYVFKKTAFDDVLVDCSNVNYFILFPQDQTVLRQYSIQGMFSI